MSGLSAPQQANGAGGRPLRAPPVVSLAVRAAVGLDSLTKGYGSGARAVTALGGVTVAFGAAAQASAWPIWLLIGLIVAFAAVALLNTALMTTAGRPRRRAAAGRLPLPARRPRGIPAPAPPHRRGPPRLRRGPGAGRQHHRTRPPHRPPRQPGRLTGALLTRARGRQGGRRGESRDAPAGCRPYGGHQASSLAPVDPDRTATPAKENTR